MSPRSVFAADLDGDGDQDLAVANYGSNNVSVLKNNGDGTFASAVNYATGTGTQSVCRPIWTGMEIMIWRWLIPAAPRSRF